MVGLSGVSKHARELLHPHNRLAWLGLRAFDPMDTFSQYASRYRGFCPTDWGSAGSVCRLTILDWRSDSTENQDVRDDGLMPPPDFSKPPFWFDTDSLESSKNFAWRTLHGHVSRPPKVYQVKVAMLQCLPFLLHNASSTARGGGGSFKNEKPIGEIGCCESRMTKQKHWQTAQLSNRLTD